MRSVLASLLVLGSIPLSASALPVSLADGTFADADWSAAEILDTAGTASFAAAQQLAGGNPDAFRQTQHSIPGAGQSIIVDHVYSAGHYAPAASGAIDHIDFALDVRFAGGSVGTSQVGYQLILLQGDAHYNALSTGAVALGPGGGAPGAWLSFTFPNLTQSSFTRVSGTGPDRPDFSATGGEIRFGYLTQNTSIDTAIATTSGIDNWSVTIFAPEPPASALLGAALVGVAAATVRRRPCAPRASVEDSRDAGSLPPL